MEQLIEKSEKILLDKVQDRCDVMMGGMNFFSSTNKVSQKISSNTFREVVKRLQSFGLLNVIVESAKFTENVFVNLLVFHDEINVSFETHEILLKFKDIITTHSSGGQ